jgi:putative colanic acid biosynthesis UDP-glucose lipid carrier transferase
MSTGYFRIGLAGGAIALLQAIAAPLICVATLVIAVRFRGIEFTDEYLALAVVAALICYIAIRPQRDHDQFGSGWAIARHVALAWTAAVVVLLVFGYATKITDHYSRLVLGAWFVATPVFITAALFMLRAWFRHIVVTRGEARSAIVTGVNDVSRRLAQSLVERPELGLRFKGYFDDRAPDRLGPVEPGKLLGQLADVPAYVKRHRTDVIFVALPINHLQKTKDLLEALRDTTASIYFVPDIFVYDLIQARTDQVNGIPVMALCETPLHGWQGLAKRSSDVVFASLLLAIASPVMLAITVGIKLTSPGSIIFKQRRYGLDGEEIIVYKFRTMTVSEDGGHVAQAQRNDKRVTPFGAILRRYSLDELPQLINVLQGRMSVVGPRPHAVAHNEIYRKLIGGYMVRHKVAPGITGLAQVNGYRGETVSVDDMEKRIEYDLEYLRQWSLWLDVKILYRTIMVLMRDEKAY